jgi:hypothetical protein
MRLVRRIVALLLGAALLATPGVSSADVLQHRDAIGDVARAPVGTNTYSPVPDQAHGDIVATRVVHAKRAIWVQIRLRVLTTRSNGNFHLVSVKTRWRTRNVEIDAFPGHWDGSATTTDGRGRPVTCAVMHRINYDRQRVMVRIPRSCLGAPPWVRVGIRTTVAGSLYAYADDARRTGLGSSLAYGRKIPL